MSMCRLVLDKLQQIAFYTLNLMWHATVGGLWFAKISECSMHLSPLRLAIATAQSCVVYEHCVCLRGLATVSALRLCTLLRLLIPA